MAWKQSESTSQSQFDFQKPHTHKKKIWCISNSSTPTLQQGTEIGNRNRKGQVAQNKLHNIKKKKKKTRKTLSEQALSSGLCTTWQHTHIPHIHYLLTRKILKTVKFFNLTVKNLIELELVSPKYINQRYTYTEFKINNFSIFHKGLQFLSKVHLALKDKKIKRK